MNGLPLGADLFDESVIDQVAAREDWSERNRERWETLKASFLNDLGVHDLWLWESVDLPRRVAFTSRFLDELSAEVLSRGGSLTPILDAIARLEHGLRSRARVRVENAKRSAQEQTGYTMTVDHDPESNEWVSTAQHTPAEEDSGDEPKPVPLAQRGSELEAAEEGLEVLRTLPLERVE
jgi:hypothetical protein